MHKLLPVLLFALACSSAAAQRINIKGSVQDTSSHSKVQNAVVTVMTPKDSVLKSFTRVRADGSFELKNLLPGKYIVSVSHPLFADFIDDTEFTSSTSVMPLIALTPKSKLLAEVIIKSGNPIRIKGDTTIYTADSFSVAANANVEELLKKLPGIQVDKNGQIKAMGVTVERVLVDGEEFFGDDPGMAVKNLRADAVKEVQVFDKKSEQAEFTGIDDGKTQKTINLKLKEDRKKGYFGKIDQSGGVIKDLDARYNTNMLLSSFKGKRKISGFVISGNTGEDRLNWQDEQKYGGESEGVTMMDEEGGFMMSIGGQGNDEEPYLDAQNGYMNHMSAGGQYSNKWNEKQTLSISPRYNMQDYLNRNSRYRQTLLKNDSSLNEISSTITDIRRHNVKLSGSFESKIDSFNTIKLVVRRNSYHTASAERRSAITTDQDSATLNTSFRDFSTANDKTVSSATLLYNHKFKKLRRTFSTLITWKDQVSDGKNFLQSDNRDVINGLTQKIDQMKEFNREAGSSSAKVVYTEPLGKKYAIELGYEYRVNTGRNDELTFSPSTGGKYETPVDSLTNSFDQRINQHTPSFKLNYAHKKLKVNLGAGVALTDFKLEDISFDTLYERDYANYFPFATLNYTYKSNHNIRFNYNGNTRQPTINQLQPLRNNNDFFNEVLGNPNLQPSFQHSLNLSHNSYNFLKDTWMYQTLYANITENAITSNRTILNSGKTITQPVNTDGNYSVGFWSGLGSKLKKADIRYNVSPNMNFNRYVSVLNGEQFFSKSLRTGLGVDLSKSKDKKYDISLNNNIEYNRSSGDQNPQPIKYISNTLGLNATVYYKKVWSLNSEIDYYTREKTAQAPAFQNTLWHARLQRTFKKDEFTAYINVRDILNENRGLDRNFYENTFTETRNDRLRRYVMIGFTWNFKNKNAAPAQ